MLRRPTPAPVVGVRSAANMLRILRVLVELGPHNWHQLGRIAHRCGLQPNTAHGLLATAVAEAYVEKHPERQGRYRLLPLALALAGPTALVPHPAESLPTHLRVALGDLHDRSTLAVALHKPDTELGRGLTPRLTSLLAAPHELSNLAEIQQHPSPYHTAAGRALIALTPAALRYGPTGEPLVLPAAEAARIQRTRLATRPHHGARGGLLTLSTVVHHHQAIVAAITLIAPVSIDRDLMRSHARRLLTTAEDLSAVRAATTHPPSPSPRY